jgi:ATP-binding cassette, subfamily B, vacuolar membrane transporter HMT1/ACLQ
MGVRVEKLTKLILCVGYHPAPGYQFTDHTSYDCLKASAIALFLFFIAMLLPDPDLPYNPGSPNYHAWVTNLIFEVTLIAILSRKIGFQDEKADKISVQLVLQSLKTVILLVMSILYKISCSKPSYTSEAEDAERRQLLGSGSSDALGNGTIENGIRRNKPAPTATDAQSTTWLDYLIAFKTLFRYVW